MEVTAGEIREPKRYIFSIRIEGDVQDMRLEGDWDAEEKEILTKLFSEILKRLNDHDTEVLRTRIADQVRRELNEHQVRPLRPGNPHDEFLAQQHAHMLEEERQRNLRREGMIAAQRMAQAIRGINTTPNPEL